MRIDTPFGWRVTAHGIVIAIVLAVFAVSRFPSALASEGAEPGEWQLMQLAQRVSQSTAFLKPVPVIGTHGSTTTGSEGIGGPPEEASPGFISPGLSAEADPALLPWDEPQVYVVLAGDTISGIAEQFGLEPETLLYANPDMRENPHNLSIGDTITILPVNGVLHVVEDGETVEAIAEQYEAAAEDIVEYAPNGLTPGQALVAGTEIVVPGGQMEIEIPSLINVYDGPGRMSAVWASDGGNGPVAGSGSFHIASYGRISQWFTRWHRAIDIANSIGTPIYAIDSGTVEVAGWYGWAGNCVILDHGNGYESLYAHMNGFSVGAGQTVQRGQIIGTVGCSRGRGGRCTGPHLHLEVFFQGGRVNPCSVGACP